jgi:hypothetical protein
MWTEIVTYDLPLGDKFIVERRSGSTDYKNWRGLVKKKNGEIRESCTPTRFKNDVDEYFKIVELVQHECLEGRNPYVSKEYALAYRSD